jgi:translation initiation factor 5A
MVVRQGTPGEIKKGSFIMIDGHPCKCINVDSSAPGKHGHRKFRIDARSLFDGSKHTLLTPSHTKIEIPIVDKRQAQVLSIGDDKIQVMDLENYETFDLDVPEDKKGTFTEGSQVSYWEVLDRKILPTMS